MKGTMMTTTPIIPKGQTILTRHMHPLQTVIAWEIRRLYASRLVWAVALGAFGAFLFLLWTQRAKYSIGGADMDHGYSFTGSVAETSAQGFLLVVPGTVLLLLGLLLPFVSGDGVARDLGRRTHELLMTTTVPTWAYVWGRYLVGLLLSLGLALLLLAAILGMGLELYLTAPDYPAPQVGALVALWGALVVPVTLLVSSISFAVATLLPRYAHLVKIGTLACWFLAAIALPAVPYQSAIPTWYVQWDPTGLALSKVAVSQFDQAVQQQLNAAVQSHSVSQLLVRLEQQMPDIGSWLAPHLIWAGLGLVLAMIAARSFKRFQGAFQ
jgi:ABC-type transport system involved in multi-copper enzyme maturation permease subunit